MTNFAVMNTYVYHKKAAEQFLATAENSEEGQFYNCMAVIVFSAFAIGVCGAVALS